MFLVQHAAIIICVSLMVCVGPRCELQQLDVIVLDGLRTVVPEQRHGDPRPTIALQHDTAKIPPLTSVISLSVDQSVAVPSTNQ